MTGKTSKLADALSRFPRVRVGHLSTPLEPLENLGADLGLSLFAKRDDCTGFGFGGNKVRQLEFYLGKALAEKADTILITGAVQSNFVRTAAAMARRFDMDIHVQLEDRVKGEGSLYHRNGNVLLDELIGARIHQYPEGEDEAGADAAMAALAEELRSKGRKPFIVGLGIASPPTGALGYVEAAIEVHDQIEEVGGIDDIVIASGSALTHAGLLYGLRAIGSDIPIYGICVRRDGKAQTTRVAQRFEDIESLTGLTVGLHKEDVRVFGGVLAPGYGKLNQPTIDAIRRTASREGLFLDPVYTGKVMAGLIALANANKLAGRRVLFWHTGGLPALFAYADQLSDGERDMQ